MPLIGVVRQCSMVLSAAIAISFFVSGAKADSTLTFDDMPGEVLDTIRGFKDANGGVDTTYQGITWDSRLGIVGDQYKVGNGATDPFYAMPHSGHFALTNGGGNTSILITTNQVLTSAWFGRNQFYGFGGGSDQVTINAMSGDNVLQSIVFNLPENNPGFPEPLNFADTSSFQSLNGITGYRIDTHPLGDSGGNWVADDFTFASPSAVVPEPSSLRLALPILGLIVGVLVKSRRKR